MKSDAIGAHDAERRQAAARFIGSCICEFCRHASAGDLAQWEPRLQREVREYAQAEAEGMGRAAKVHRNRILDILGWVRSAKMNRGCTEEIIASAAGARKLSRRQGRR